MPAQQPTPVVVEFGRFDRLRRKRLSDAAYAGFRSYITETPEAGDVMPRTGGWRKVRWAETGRGKSGGVRIIYLYRAASGRVYLADIYAKNERASLSRADEQALLRIRDELD